MDKCICGHNKFEEYNIEDIGFDHNNYQKKISKKKYLVCKVCSTIFRCDNNIRNPFDEKYFRHEENRYCTRKVARNKELIENIDLVYSKHDEFTVDFGLQMEEH